MTPPRRYSSQGLRIGSSLYSILQPALARAPARTQARQPRSGTLDLIGAADIGCTPQLQAATGRPLRHRIEWLDERFAGG